MRDDFPSPDDYAKQLRAQSSDDLLREMALTLMGLQVELTYLRQMVQSIVGEGPDRLIVNVYDHGRDELPN